MLYYDTNIIHSTVLYHIYIYITEYFVSCNFGIFLFNIYRLNEKLYNIII